MSPETVHPDLLEQVRTVADAVLYEGYLLYPYRASSGKNQARWQFGVLGPPGAAQAGFGEEPSMSMQCLLRKRDGQASVQVHLRCLQLQVRQVQARDPSGEFRSVADLTVDGRSVLSWEEAVECAVALPPVPSLEPSDTPVEFAGGQDVEDLLGADGSVVGRIVRTRQALQATVRCHGAAIEGLVRLTVTVTNAHSDPVEDKQKAIETSLIGAHLILHASDGDFLSVIDPPAEASEAAASCQQHRCWPVLAGSDQRCDMVLGAPIILYDYPHVAQQSRGEMFDATEIDEILTLRVLTMTEQEKAEARATDPRAREVIDRCEAMTMGDLQQLHGILRDPHAAPVPSERAEPAPTEPAESLRADPFDTGGVPRWDPEAEAEINPDTDSVLVNGVAVSRGSLVRVHPCRRADAQDLFFADQVARVTAVLQDLDGAVHVALVLVDDPAADLHEWYGRYFYFAPEEIEPLGPPSQRPHREESPTWKR